jgi:hypothetical protein
VVVGTIDGIILRVTRLKLQKMFKELPRYDRDVFTFLQNMSKFVEDSLNFAELFTEVFRFSSLNISLKEPIFETFKNTLVCFIFVKLIVEASCFRWIIVVVYPGDSRIPVYSYN